MPEPWRFNGELGAIIYDPEDGFMASAEGRPDAELVAYFVTKNRRTYIAQLETLAAMAPYTTWPERFAGRRVTHFIDNTVALSSLVHGYARQTDMAEMVNAFHLLMAGLKTATYMDYVPSKANIADDPSRGTHDLPIALGAVVEQGGLRAPTYSMLSRPPEAWLVDGEKHGRGHRWPV